MDKQSIIPIGGFGMRKKQFDAYRGPVLEGLNPFEIMAWAANIFGSRNFGGPACTHDLNAGNCWRPWNRNKAVPETPPAPLFKPPPNQKKIWPLRCNPQPTQTGGKGGNRERGGWPDRLRYKLRNAMHSNCFGFLLVTLSVESSRSYVK